MASLPIHWILARTYCQVTEEETRVAQALDATVSGGEVSRHAVEGQHGNPVLVLERRLDSSGDLHATWERWSAAGLVTSLRDEVDTRVDDDAILHLRVDKQLAFQGVLALGRDGDVIDIQAKLKAYPAKPEEIRKVARKLVTGGS